MRRAFAATRYWRLAAAEAEEGGVPVALLTTHYEYGRALGVTGQFEAVEAQLVEALELDEKNHGEVFMDLTELARLNYDQRKYAVAISFYEREFPILSMIGADVHAPADMIVLLTEYADCLRQVGRTDDSNRATARAAEFRNQNPNLPPATDRTPYGTVKVRTT